MNLGYIYKVFASIFRLHISDIVIFLMFIAIDLLFVATRRVQIPPNEDIH